MHKNYEVVYVLNGTCDLIVDDEPVHLEKQDFIMINSGQRHSYHVGADSLIGRFHIPYSQVTGDTEDDRTVVIALNSRKSEKKAALEKVQRILNLIMESAYKGDKEGDLVFYQRFHGLMDVLLENFAHEEKMNPRNAMDAETDRRICDIIEYINLHYNESISLNALASKLYLTTAYLSKYIKQQLGINFVELVVKTRLAHAETALANTDTPIAQIALDVGFSNLASFNRSFKERHGVTPSQYRKNCRGSAGAAEETAARAEENTADESGEDIGTMQADAANVREGAEAGERDNGSVGDDSDAVDGSGDADIQGMGRLSDEDVIYDEILVEEINRADKTPLNRSWNRTINIGSAEELLHSDVQNHVLMLKNELHFRYVRFWDIYSPGMYLNEHHEGQIYNFGRLDRVLDFLVENHLVPHIEVSNKPKKLMRELGDNMMPPQKGDSPFKSDDMIRYFFSAWMRHLMRRYGATELDKWCIEFWMEEEEAKTPGEWLEYTPEMIDTYLDQFEILGQTIRRFGTKIKLGGGGFSLRFGEKWFDYAIHQWRMRPQQPDFISMYVYPYALSYAGTCLNHRVLRTDFIVSSIRYAQSVLKREKMNCRLAVTEWNITVFNRSLINDSLFKGAWIMKNLMECLNMCDILAYWVGSDLYAECYDVSGFIGGSCGLLTQSGLKKPAWYAFEFMNSLERTLYKKSENVVVTRGKYKDWRIACHNFKPMSYAYYMRMESEITIRDLHTMSEDSRLLRLYFELPVLRDDEYRIKFLRVNRDNGSIQDEWERMSSPAYMDTEDLIYLKNRCVPQITIRSYREKDEKIAFTTVLEPNEIQLILVECLGRNL